MYIAIERKEKDHKVSSPVGIVAWLLTEHSTNPDEFLSYTACVRY
jgi:hypothetical protein